MSDDKVRLHNTNKEMSVEVTAADGESIMLMPNAKEEVEARFAWNLPKGVKIFKPNVMVFGTDEQLRELAVPVSEVIGETSNTRANQASTTGTVTTTAPATTATASAKAEAKKS
jgi:hypothetical protein